METWELIGKKLSGELTPAESLHFDEWIKTDASNEAIWEDAQKLWATTGRLDYTFDPNTEIALQKVKATRVVELRPKKFFTPLKIAASIFFIAIPVFVILQVSSGKKQKDVVTEDARVTVPVLAKTKMLTAVATDSAISFYLPDSTHIFLNKNSSMTYPENFTEAIRSVSLSGEAFFEVVSNPSKPFVIEAGDTETKVVGTSFNIREDKSSKKVEVTVLTGQVKFKSKKNSDRIPEMTLLPQDRAVYSGTNASIVKQKVKSNESYWWIKKVDVIRKKIKDVRKELHKPGKKKEYPDSSTKQFQIKKRPISSKILP